MNQPLRSRGQLRADTALAMHAILEQGQSSREVLPTLQQSYTTQDQAWLQEMLFGVLRQLPLLQYWLRQLLDKPLKQRSKIVEHLILLGFYQLAFSRVSQHAAVAETVNACGTLKLPGMKGLVNAVLRNFIRQDWKHKRSDNPQIQSGLPKWLYKQLQAAYPQQLEQIIQACQHKAPVWLRINQQQIQLSAYTAELEASRIEFALSSLHPCGLILQHPGDITQLPGYHQGHFAVQDGAAQLAAQLLNPKHNERILDCCAAPGGKSGHILERANALQLTALEIDAKRMQRVKENLDRLQHRAELLVGDAATPETWWTGELFDRILLDAPCSATGIIRRYPDIKWLRKGSDIQPLVDMQAQILDAIWPLLKPGGTLLYATCSILPQENQQQIEAFIQRTPNALHDPLDQAPATLGWQILPGEQQMDGFYYARLLKSESGK